MEHRTKVMIILVGCLSLLLGYSSAKVAHAEGKDGLGVRNLTVLGGNPGGPMGIMSEGFCESIRRTYRDVNVTMQPGGDGPNQVRAATGEVQFGGGYGATIYAAYAGAAPYDKAYSDLRVVTALNNKAAFQFLTRDKSGITSFDQIREQKYPLKVSVNKKGSMMELAGKAVLNAYGITYADIEKWGGKVYYEAFNNSVPMIKTGALDAIVGIPEYPSSAYLEIASNVDVHILALSTDVIEKVSKNLGGVRRGIVPANTYPFLKNDLSTFVTSLVVVASTSQPDDLVYGVVKAFHDNLSYYRSTYGSVNDFTSKDMTVYRSIPFHPGAEKFYKEVGLIK